MYLREFVSSDAAPTPIGDVATGNAPPMTIGVIVGRFSLGYRTVVISDALRSAYLNTQSPNLVTRINEELRRLFCASPS